MTNDMRPHRSDSRPHGPPRPERVLVQPVWLIALALLIFNDHLFKGSGILPGAVTGKLSDFVGLIVAPALLATLLRATSARALIAVHVAIGAVFAAINVSPAAAGAMERLMALGPFPWHITVDPWDLIALPTLFYSYRLCRTAAARPTAVARPLSGFLLSIGLVASAATEPPIENFPAQFNADLVIGAASNDTLILRIRPLRDTVSIDCATALRNPSGTLSRELFGPARAWRVDPDQVTVASANGFVSGGECSAVLVDGTLHRGRLPAGGSVNGSGEPIPMALVFWTSRDFPPEFIDATRDDAPEDRLLLVRRGDDGPRWGAHSAIFPAPPVIAPTPLPGCEAAPAGGVVDWQTPIPIGVRTIEAIASTPDGCHRLSLAGAAPWYLCTGTAEIPFVAGDRVQISTQANGQSFLPMDGLLLLGDGDAQGKRVSLARGGDLAPFGRGSWEVRDLPECGDGTFGPCGNLVFPQTVIIDGPDGRVEAMPGDVVSLDDGSLIVHRAERIPIGDVACMSQTDDDLVLESVYLSPSLNSDPE